MHSPPASHVAQGQPAAQRLRRSAPAALWQVAQALAPHLPGQNPLQRVLLQQRMAQLPSDNAQQELAGLQTLHGVAMHVLHVLVQQPEAAAAGAEAEADAADVRALALRRAHALAQRRGCGNPCCASMEGASEAEARGSRCGGCRLLRFCGVPCSKQEWRWHKLACKALREEAAA